MPQPIVAGVQLMHPDAKMPERSTPGAACFDIRTLDAGEVPAGRSRTFRTGLAFELPPGFVLLIFSRSGHGFGHDLRLANCVGVIDSDYRGEVQVKITSDGEQRHIFPAGSRIAQGLILQLPDVQLQQREELSTTARGSAGLGSTGNA